VRRHAGRAMLVAFNLNARDVTVPVPAGIRLRQLQCPGPTNGRIERGELKLPANAAVFADVES